MGFKNGDAVTVRYLSGDAYRDMISQGDEGVVSFLFAIGDEGQGHMYSVAFPGFSGDLVLYEHELALTASLQPPTSREPVVGDRVVITNLSPARTQNSYLMEGLLGTVMEVDKHVYWVAFTNRMGQDLMLRHEIEKVG